MFINTPQKYRPLILTLIFSQFSQLYQNAADDMSKIKINV
jgi:hypothetical protein